MKLVGVLAVAEVCAVMAAGAIGVLWVRDPSGPYEPIAFVVLLVGITGVEVVRRAERSPLRRFLVLAGGFTATAVIASQWPLSRHVQATAAPTSPAESPIDAVVLVNQINALPLSARDQFRSRHLGLKIRSNGHLTRIQNTGDDLTKVSVMGPLAEENPYSRFHFDLNVSRTRYPKLLLAKPWAVLTVEGTIGHIDEDSIKLDDGAILDLDLTESP